ncbi:C45 family autoproteolytic acyltransferase/hydrolase [Lacinutrix iliipiscaria]|uniref:C45 family autoproteolytic acyltransferase/hydrolase n=1 Tax=Lacinutrix iliipiscaria TaxID=1230532 RepID=A0ABW5WTU2_9FLAO
MKFKAVLLLFFVFAFTSFSQKKNNRELKHVTLSGSGYELGLQHGSLLKSEIAEIVSKWKQNTTQTFQKDSDSIVSDFFKYAHFTEAIKKWTPELYEEIRGIADGSGQDFNDIFILNLLDEFWVYIDDLSNHHCSDVGVASVNGSPSYIAQNMDIETYTDGYQTLITLQRHDNKPEQLILTHPGLIALNGMNENGVGVVVNTIMQLKASSEGLPVAFVIRRIINSTDKEDLLTFIQSVNHASGQNYIIGIRGEVYDFEASANEVVRYDPKNKNGTVYHTNHPIVNTDVKAWYKNYNPNLKDESLPRASNSYVRLDALKSRMLNKFTINDEIIKEALRSKDNEKHPVCNSNTENAFGFTFASVVMTLTETPYLQITAGPPDESEFTRIDFSKK